MLDTHIYLVAELSVRVKQATAASSPSLDESFLRIAFRELNHLQKSHAAITSVISDTTTTLLDMSTPTV